MFGLPAAATSVGNQSRPEKMPFSTEPGLILPGQRMMAGTRKPPSYTVPLVARNGVMPPSGQVNTSAPLSVVKIDDGVVGLADVVEVLEQVADAVVHLRHAGFFEAVIVLGVHLRLILLRQVGEDVHARGVVPDEERLAVLLGLIHEALAVLDQHLVEGLHVVFGGAALLPDSGDPRSCSWNGASGPSSTIRCLPTLPQRGITVGSSTSVA